MHWLFLGTGNDTSGSASTVSTSSNSRNNEAFQSAAASSNQNYNTTSVLVTDAARLARKAQGKHSPTPTGMYCILFCY